MSPDPYSGSYDFSNPQSLNRYSYVMNNPLTFTDPNGLEGDGSSEGNGSAGSEGDDDGFCLPCDLFELGGTLIAAGLDDLLSDIFNGQHKYQGSFKPRPTVAGDPAGFGENLGLPTSMPEGNWGLSLALNLPSEGCEFGGCGGGLGFGNNPQGVPSNITIDIPSAVWFWATHGNHSAVGGPWHHGNWCGVGGSGNPTDNADAGCMIHDYCYAKSGLTALDNWAPLSSAQANAIRKCNQQLCDNEWFSGGGIPSASIQLFFSFYGITGGRYSCNGKGPGN